jgi:hypothetical protein
LIKRFKLAAGFGVLAVSAAGILALATPAQAAADDCTTVTVQNRVGPDSGENGNDWATATVTRKLRVCVASKPATGDWTYKATVTDKGTFVTLAGDSPGAGAAAKLKGGFKGDVDGGFTASFTAPKDWDGSLVKPAPGTPTGEWVAKAFLGAKFDTKGAVAGWKWEYTTCAGEKWVNAEKGNSGDITEKVCPTPTKSPTTKPTATPAATAPGASGGLPVTGTSLPLIAGGGLALLVVGAGAVWLTRRRVRVEA